MKVLAWVTEGGWEAVIDAAAAIADADVTLLHVAPGDVVDAPRGALAGLLGRHRGRELEERLTGLSGEAAEALLDEAAARLGGTAARSARSGRVERVVLDAAEGMDVLVMSRDALQPGPRSLGHAARFVLDHARCRVLLVWPGEPAEGPPPPPHEGPPPPPPRH